MNQQKEQESLSLSELIEKNRDRLSNAKVYRYIENSETQSTAVRASNNSQYNDILGKKIWFVATLLITLYLAHNRENSILFWIGADNLEPSLVVIYQSIIWLAFGIINYRLELVSKNTPKILGRILFWYGIPLKIFFLARQSDFSSGVWLPSAVMVAGFFFGFSVTLLILIFFKKILFFEPPEISHSNPSQLSSLLDLKPDFLEIQNKFWRFYLPSKRKGRGGSGGFILASILGNTGSVGLNLVPLLVGQKYWSWIVLFGVSHLVLGSFGFGVWIADHYSPVAKTKNWQQQIVKLLLLPAIWAFVFGYFGREVFLPNYAETIIATGVSFVVPLAFCLIGMELSRIQQRNIRLGIVPTLIKMLIIPGAIGLALTKLGINGDQRLVLVLMAGMPTPISAAILSRVYDLDADVVVSSILLSTLCLPFCLFFWLNIF